MSHLSDSNLLPPSDWVKRFISLIPRDAGPVLDVACGRGRHTRLLLDLGFEVWALDNDARLLAPLSEFGARTFQVDLETAPSSQADSNSTRQLPVCWPFESHLFAGILVTNYLHRPLFPYLKSALSTDGVLIYETFAAGNEAFGRPKNPDFLLQAGELLTQFESDPKALEQLHVIAYEHGYVDKPSPAMLQRICVRSVPRSIDPVQLNRLDRI